MLKNWKTTLTGAGTLVTALGGIMSHFASTGITSTDIAAVIAAIGLITAKDSDVAGT